jgi:HlyD family secretion protein
MSTTIRRPTHDEVLAEVGDPAPSGLRKLLRAGLVGLAVLLVIGLVAWRVYFATPTPMKFVTSAVRRGDLSSTITATGTLQGRGTVNVGAETSGLVSAVYVDFNDNVKAGQLLAEVDPAVTKAALAQAEAQLMAARANVKSAEASAKESKLVADRTRGLAAEGLASKQALETALATSERNFAQAEAARAQVIVAAANVESSRTALIKTQVRSPVDGVVLSRSVEVGQSLAVAMTMPELFKVARDLRDMELTIAIDEADVGRAKAGQEATFRVDAWPDRTFKGELQSIRNVATTKDNVVTYAAILLVKNDELLLRPGMTATATVQTDKRTQVLLVPTAALRFVPPPPGKGTLFNEPAYTPDIVEANEPKVWVLRDGRPDALRVRPGLTDGVAIEVSGEQLKEGLEVITDAEEEAK